MALIHVLDEVTANQIAAGEVVERPVNAVKEMVENAVDAGASDIEVEIADGGLTYIRVTDNGSGMSAEDAKLSIVRHATSKISTVDNIYHIASLGFRGEALASISAVSRTAITTRRQEDVEGTIVEVEGGTVSEVKPTGAPGGTTIEVRDLFYNVPARKKFLKSERTEASRINTMMGKLALANPDISFRLINNGRTVIETPGNGRLLDVVSALYGTKTAGEMLEVSGENERGILSGLISKPSLLKSSRQYQTIIINRRVVESSAVSKAVDNAYHSLLPKNGYPILVLAFTVAPELIDVNVHPQKREIKFSDEQSIFRLVYHSVLQSLTTKDTPDEIAREMIKDPGHQVAKESDFDLTSVKVEETRSVGPDIGLTEKEKDPARWGEPGAAYAAEERRPMPAWHPQGKPAGERREIPFEPTISKEKLFSKESVFPGVTHEEKEALTPEVLFDAPKAEEPISRWGRSPSASSSASGGWIYSSSTSTRHMSASAMTVWRRVQRASRCRRFWCLISSMPTPRISHSWKNMRRIWRVLASPLSRQARTSSASREVRRISRKRTWIV